MGERNQWPGKALRVDLSTSNIKQEEVSPEFFLNYLGGRGFNARVLFDGVKRGIDPLGSDNLLILGIGPLDGTLAPGADKFTITAKSPLTDIFGSSSSSSDLVPQLRMAGFSMIQFTGKSPHPVYVFIDDDHVEIRDAHHIWGKDTWATQEMIQEELHDPAVQVVCIGQAGENLVRFASVSGGKKSTAGRTGLGAVMGSKNLKAIAVRGTKDIEVISPDIFARKCQVAIERIKNSKMFETWSEMGSHFLTDAVHALGGLAVKNFTTNVFPWADKFGADNFKRRFSLKMHSCLACPVHCRHFYEVNEGEYAGQSGEAPDFGGTQVGILLYLKDIEPTLYAYDLFNKYGMDSLSFAMNLAWATECYEKGLINRSDTDGIELKWGDADTLIKLIHMTARRDGFGDVLAEGEKRAKERLGKGTGKYVYTVKGMMPVIEDPRALKGFGFSYLVSTRGADHLRSIYPRYWSDDFMKKVFPDNPEVSELTNPKGKGIGTKWLQDYSAVIDSADVCKRVWLNLPPEHLETMPDLLADLINALTGTELSGKSLLRIGDRIYNVEKAFNSREGLTRKDDNFTNPEKFTREKVPDGPAKGQVAERDMMLDEYYKARGWDVETGLQTYETLAGLGLTDIAEELSRIGQVIGGNSESNNR